MNRYAFTICVIVGLLLGCFCDTTVADGGYSDSAVFLLDVRTQSTSHYGDSAVFALDSNPRLSGKYCDSGFVTVDYFRINRAWRDSETFQIRTTDVHIDLSDIKQKIDGFGGSFAMWGYAPDSNAIDKVITELGTEIVRTQGDKWLDVNEWGRCLPVLQEARDKGASKFLLSFWTPPDEYKDPNVSDPGKWYWNNSGDNSLQWASEIASRVAAFRSVIGPDVEIFLSPQNEPDYTGGPLTCQWEPAELGELISNVRAALNANNCQDVQILCPETSHAEVQSDPNGWFDLIEWASGSTNIYGFNYHIYDNQIDYSDLANRLNNFRDKTVETELYKNWQTETSGATLLGGTYPTAGYFEGMGESNKAIAAARYIHLALTEANSSAFLWWGLTYDDHNPDEGLVLVDHHSGEERMPLIDVTKKYYAFKQYSRFVRPSYLRVGLANYSSSLISAYRSADGETVVLVIVNPNEANEGLFITGIGSYTLCRAFRTDDILDCNDVSDQWTQFTGDAPQKSITTLIYKKNCLLGDFEPDGDVDFTDLMILISQWLQTPGNPSADIAPQPNGDNFVDFRDFALLAENWLVGVEP